MSLCIFIFMGFIKTHIGVLSGRLQSMEGVIKTFILLGGAFVGQFARPSNNMKVLMTHSDV